MDIPAGGVLPRTLQAPLALAPPPAAVLPAPLAAGPVEALVVAARPAPGPTGSWSLELEIDGERVQMSSATLLAAGTRLLLRALSAQRVRVEQVLDDAPRLQPLRNALRADLPAQLPLREAIGRIALLAAEPALPEPLRARIGELLARLPAPEGLQQAAGLRAAVLNSGSFLEPRLRELLTAAVTSPLPPIAARAEAGLALAAPAPPTATGSAAPSPPGAPSAPGAPAAAAAPAAGARAALAALLRLVLPVPPARVARPDGAAAAPSPAAAPRPGAAPTTATPLYDGQGALMRGVDPARVGVAPAPGLPAGSAAAAAPVPAPVRASGPSSDAAAGATGTAATPAEPQPPAVPAVPRAGGGGPLPVPGTPAPAGTPPAGAVPTAPVAPAAASANAAEAGRRPEAFAATPGSPAGGAGPAALPAAPADVAADLKGRLFVLLEAVSAWLRERADTAHVARPGAGDATPVRPLYTARGVFAGDATPGQTALPVAVAAELPAPRIAQQASAYDPARPRDPGDLVETLMRYVVGALARTRVHQLGAHPESHRQSDSGAVQAWSVEIPIAHGGRLDALELQVEDHGRREGPHGPERLWQVLMSLELDQVGALHALLRLSGARLATTLWVENPATLVAARDTLAELGDCLRAEGIEVTRLECLPGTPPPRARVHDALLDVRT